MKLVVGLGNPGKDYEETRHNVGFKVLDALAAQLEGKYCATPKFNCESFEATVHGEKVIFAKPQTFMNNSGESVAKLASYYKLEAGDIWVISDDLDMPLGMIRTRLGGSSGGHNGLNSIIERLNSEDFWRIRVGIEQLTQPHESIEASIFVLQPFEKKERAMLAKSIDQAKRIVLDALNAKALTAHSIEIP